MPRVIDTEERIRLVSEAAWRVLTRDGLGGLSVRRIAAEAGLPPSSLRYVFPTQASVRVRAFELVNERLAERVQAIPRSAGWHRAVLLELLPLDEGRRLEMEVGLAFGIAAMTDPALRDAHRAAHQGLRAICTEVAESASSTTDVEVEAARLHALVDGLALHLVLQEPDEDPAWAVRALDAHLDALL
ncbi:TetR/AcrR family transcriptional regulator [Streptomyces fuscichromogenes]|uniref:TetR/AcrR family transcriptional regulator n=1 Tax=Streptomyces fuscichromogenes TaxID=1324013 RepID=UPI0037F9F10A